MLEVCQATIEVTLATSISTLLILRLQECLLTIYSDIPGVTSAGFRNGFHGFCGVFVNAAFAYTGTELTGLAAAETDNPKKEIPKASKQVIYRIILFYVVNLAIVGLDVPVNNAALNGSAGASSLHSPFVIAIQLAGIKVLPSIFNAVILIAVMSVANSCTFGSTRTMQALSANGECLES